MHCQSNVTRIFKPIDANFIGTVHGGTILQIAEEVGYISASRYCLIDEETKMQGTECFLSRVEYLDFMKPMCIGDIVDAKANVIFANSTLMAIKIDMTTQKLYHTDITHSCRALLWYKVVKYERKGQMGKLNTYPIKPMDVDVNFSGTYFTGEMLQKLAENLESEASLDFQSLLQDDWCTVMKISVLNDSKSDSKNGDSLTTVNSVHMIGPFDCHTVSKMAYGGSLMKWMDETGALSAFRHAKNPLITARVHNVDFYCGIPVGSLVTILARVVFSSNKTLEVQILTVYESPFQNKNEPFVASSGFFVFSTYGTDGKPVQTKPFIPVTPSEIFRFEKGKDRYEARKTSSAN